MRGSPEINVHAWKHTVIFYRRQMIYFRCWARDSRGYASICFSCMLACFRVPTQRVRKKRKVAVPSCAFTLIVLLFYIKFKFDIGTITLNKYIFSAMVPNFIVSLGNKSIKTKIKLDVWIYSKTCHLVFSKINFHMNFVQYNLLALPTTTIQHT